MAAGFLCIQVAAEAEDDHVGEGAAALGARELLEHAFLLDTMFTYRVAAPAQTERMRTGGHRHLHRQQLAEARRALEAALASAVSRAARATA